MSSSTNMTNPPGAQVKMVKIKALYPIRVMKDKAEHIVSPGQEIAVTEAEAKEFCDTKFNIGFKDSFGNHEASSYKPRQVARAERVSEK